MADSLIPLKLPPGLYRNGTKYQSAGRWYDGNGVRFIGGAVQPIGGWQRATDDAGIDLAALAGVPRRVLTWSGSDGQPIVAIGTHQKLYVLVGGVLHDVTPAGFVPGGVDTTSVSGSGAYGHGPYGTGAYGTGSVATQLVECGLWHLDTFGSYLAAVGADEKLYVWQGDVGTPAAVPDGAPTSAIGVVVTPERFLVVLGANGDPRKVQWPSQETIDVWDPTLVGSTAGDFPLTTNGRLRCGRRTKTETLLWTDCDVHRMGYIGGVFVYRFDQVGDNCGIIAPNAVAVNDTRAFWMGRDTFWVYDGFVKPLPCEVREAVFEDINERQVAKIWAVSIAEFGEIWWFYPSAGSAEINRYVVYNYRENHWSLGTLARTAGADAGSTQHPILCDAAGLVYEHELTEVRSGIAPYLESGPVEVGSGDRLMSVQRIVPDEKTSGDVSLSLYAANFPNAPERVYGPYPAAQETKTRLNARQVRLRLDEVRPADWRVGTFRLGVRESSRR
ncbi:MAG TPA: hypothetical protein VF159_03265 [Gemmatimonadaceae bacterium]